MKPQEAPPLLRALAALALVAAAPSQAQAQDLAAHSAGPATPLAHAFSGNGLTQQVPDPFLVLGFGPTVARNLELSAFRLGAAIEAVVRPASLNQVLSLSANVGRLATEFRNYWTASLMVGTVFGQGPLLGSIHPRARAGIVADRSSFTTGASNTSTHFGPTLAAGVMYGLTQALVGGADVSIERVAGITQVMVTLTLMLGPLGSLSY